MSVPTRDPILRDARRQMAAAAEHLARGYAVLLPAMRALEGHPDFAFTERAAAAPSAERLTLAWWLHAGCRSALEDGGKEAAAWLRDDATEGGAERTLATFIATEEQDLARQRRRSRRPRVSAPGYRPKAPQRRLARRGRPSASALEPVAVPSRPIPPSPAGRA